MRCLIVTTMRNEGPFILEWIAYHRAIGVTDFLIFSNDCEDGTDEILDRLHALKIVCHKPNPRKGKKTVQWQALSRASNHRLVEQADWILVSDVDEFLCIHEGSGQIADLIAARPDADGFAIPWRMFGHNQQVAFQDQPMTRLFTRAAPATLLWPWRAVQFKTLFRADQRLDRLGVHRPRLQDGAEFNMVDGNGDPAPAIPGTVIPSVVPRYGLAQLNHYALGSVENYLVKAERGRPNHSEDPIDLAYWIDRDFNQIEDTAILRHADAIADGMAELRADPELDQLHTRSVAWRHQRIKTLMQDSEMFYTHARLCQIGPTRVLPMTAQRRMWSQLMSIRRAIHAEKQAREQDG